MSSILSAGLALTAGLVLWFFSKLYVMRRKMRGLPGPPHHPIFGHLSIARECVQNAPLDAHPHFYADFIQRRYGLGKFFYIDFWPFGDQFLFITDPDIANQITVATSLPKSPLVVDYLSTLLGDQNIVGLGGAAWRMLRAMFNPGFASGQLMTLVPYIVDSATEFGDVLREKARTGEVFQFEEIATRLTVDIIGKVTLDVDLNSQRSDHPIVTAFRRQVSLMPVTSPANPLGGLTAKISSPPFLWYNSRKLDRYVGEALDQRYAKRGTDEKSEAAGGGGGRKKKTRYVIDLALETYERDFQDPDKKKPGSSGSSEKMDPAFRQSAITQFKTFIFAGHDTTSSTLAWIFYLMHQHPEVHSQVVEELDRVFGKIGTHPTSAEKIRAEPHLINRLNYCTAVIKETLRIFPPASTVRLGSPSVTISDPEAGDPHASYPTDTFHVWPVAHAIHRNETYFPSPTLFLPTRHLDPPSPEAKPYRDSFRPFEKGPRNCIGQELAMIEMRVIMALTMREFAFEAMYPDLKEIGMEGEERKHMMEGHRCYQVLKGSAKPKSGMPGVVTLR